MLRISISPLRPAITYIKTSCLHLRSIPFHTPDPLFNVICNARGPPYPCHSAGTFCPLALALPSTTASAMAQWPSCKVFMVGSTWVVLPAQLMGPSSWILHPWYPKGEPFLEWSSSKEQDCLLLGKDYSFGNPSSRPYWNISSINEPFHAWEGGAGCFPLPPKSLWCGCSSASNLCWLGDLVSTQVLEIILMVIGWIAGIWMASWMESLSVVVLPSMRPHHPSGHELHCLYHLFHLYEIRGCSSEYLLPLW